MVERQLRTTQKNALEKVCSKPWNSWHPEAVKAYFAYTDKGKSVHVSESAGGDLNELLFAHRHHPHDVEQWKRDFRGKLLFFEAVTEISPGRMAVQISESQLVSLAMIAGAVAVMIFQRKRAPVLQ